MYARRTGAAPYVPFAPYVGDFWWWIGAWRWIGGIMMHSIDRGARYHHDKRSDPPIGLPQQASGTRGIGRPASYYTRLITPTLVSVA